MANPTREEMEAKISASEARTETKIARMEGKLDLVLSKLENVLENNRSIREDMRESNRALREDNRSTRGNVWAVGVGLAILIVAVVALFPVFFSVGTQIRDLVHTEIHDQLSPGQTTHPYPPK
jgi:hypothetical protein